MAKKQRIDIEVNFMANMKNFEQNLSKLGGSLKNNMKGLVDTEEILKSEKIAANFNRLKQIMGKGPSKKGFQEIGKILEGLGKEVNTLQKRYSTLSKYTDAQKIRFIDENGLSDFKEIRKEIQFIIQEYKKLSQVTKISFNDKEMSGKSFRGVNTTFLRKIGTIEKGYSPKSDEERKGLLNSALKSAKSSGDVNLTAQIEEQLRGFERLEQAILASQSQLKIAREDFSKVFDVLKIDKAAISYKEFVGIADTLDNKDLEKFDITLEEIAATLRVVINSFKEGSTAAQKMSQQDLVKNEQRRQLDDLKMTLLQTFSIQSVISGFQRLVRDAFETVKELDAAMTETAVVTDFSVGDMWNQLPQYTQMANDIGASTLGAYEATTLFVQQGLELDTAMGVANETMKMGRIANMDYAASTDAMTAALRGFNMELNETSAIRVNDVYSELAAISASDTQELSTAMTKTASIAAGANMEFENTAAFLATIIETTREGAETA